MSNNIEQTPKWPFGDQFQVKVLAHCLKDNTFLPRHLDVILPSYFQREQLNAVAYLTISYFKKYGCIPTYEALVTQINSYAVTYGGERSADMLREIMEWVDVIYQLELTDAEFTHEKVIEFGKRQALKRAIEKSLLVLEDKKTVDFETIQSNFDSVFQVGAEKDFGVDLHEIALDLPKILEEDPTFGIKFKVPTGIPTLDKKLSGGLGSGEIAIIAGPPGKGKSTFLVNLGRNAMRHFKEKAIDKIVVHITLELKDRSDVALMYASSMTGIPRNDVVTSNGTYRERIEKTMPFFSKVRIKYFSPGSMEVDGLKWWLVNMQTIEKVNPGLIIVDYADKLKGGEDDRYKGMGKIYTSLIALGDRFQCPVWTGSQINREYSEEEVITGKGIADSWQKKMDADLLITLNQNQKEYRKHVCRLFLDKVRRGESFGLIWCHHRADIASMWEMSSDEIDNYRTTADVDEKEAEEKVTE